MPLTTHRLLRQVAHNMLFGAFPRTSRAPTARTDSAVTEQALSCASMTFKLWGRKVRSVAAQPWAAGLGAADAPQADEPLQESRALDG